jgi:hypothetical protein
MTKLLIQIDDLVREMTDEEQAAHLEMQTNSPERPEAQRDLAG